jgi:TnpA family transposase
MGFQLLPRLKSIARQKLYRPDVGEPDAYPRLRPVLTRPIRWDLIRQQYDEMIKYAAALRLGTADAESILRRFTRDAPQHPTYQALAELGKAVKTIFLCSYLHLEALRREIHEGLNVIENLNGANGFIFYGKGGEISTNRRDEQRIGSSITTLAAEQPGLHHHSDAPARPRGAGVDGGDDDGRPARLDAVDLYACQSVRNVFAEPG